MAITLDGTTGITATAFDGALDATDLTGDVAAARITTALNATGSAPIYACRAWVNFNGTGTVAIRASGNVSSITDNGVGDYTVNFATAMPDVNYSFTSGSVRFGNGYIVGLAEAPTTSSARVRTANTTTNTLTDVGDVMVSIFR